MTQQQCPPADQSHRSKAPARAAHLQSQPSFTSWVTPGSVLLFSSIPLGLGGYIGYRRALHESSEPPSSSTPSYKSSTSKGRGNIGDKGKSIIGEVIHRPEPPLPSSSRSIPSERLAQRAVVGATTAPAAIAARALVVGSILSVAGTSLLVSGIFYASGCRSVDELMSAWKSWAPKKLQAMENSLENATGISVGRERRSAVKEYERAINGMSEEEELDYVANKYGGEMKWDDGDDAGNGPGNK